MDAKELVLTQFPGRITIDLVQAGEAIGFKPQTSYNLHHQGKFPLKVRMLKNRKPVVDIVTLINFLEQRGGEHQADAAANFEAPAKRRRGRPTKREQIERNRDMGND